MNNQELNLVQRGKYGKFVIAFHYSVSMGNTGNAEVLWISIAEGDKSVQSILLCRVPFLYTKYIYISLAVLP